MPNIKSPILQRDAEAFFQADAELRAGITLLTPVDIATALGVFHANVIKGKPTPEQYRELAAQFTQALTLQQRSKPAGALNNGLLLRAACRAGLVVGLDESAVGEMSPGEVLKLASAVSEALQAAFDVPGE